MVDEVTITWNSELHHTGQQRFRLNPEAKDAYLPFLATHWMVERHREALLWAWVVARIGGNDDEWGPDQSAQAWKELGGAADKDSVDVRRKPRSTLHEDQMISVLDSTGDASIGKTHYAFLSRDGYPYVCGSRCVDAIVLTCIPSPASGDLGGKRGRRFNLQKARNRGCIRTQQRGVRSAVQSA